MNNPIVFFDDYCILCSRSVQFLLRIDKKKLLRYSAINSQTFREMMADNFITDIPDSILVISAGKLFTRSNAVFEILKNIGGVWRIFLCLKIIPGRLLDYFYDRIARNRYKIFGKRRSCYIPAREEKDLFLP